MIKEKSNVLSKASTYLFDINNYKTRYRDHFEAESEWLRRSAVERANSIQHFIDNNSISSRSILDLGCGTGAVLKELEHRNIAEEYTGVDYSEKAVEYLQNSSQNITGYVADITSPKYAFDKEFDVVTLMHVLQHLKDPAKCLASVLSQIKFSYLIIEIPLEDLFFNNLVTSLHLREKNPTGSLQFFNMDSLTKLLDHNNISIIDRRRYTPAFDIDTLRVLQKRYGWSELKFIRKVLTSHYLSKIITPLKMRFYYTYYAVLCKKKD